ncbi:hypothetical protein NX059_002390 [Plenodomus lindquistii]|nr:hypothetical protein NX059_002390 [Plenodomus lindquistii]
MRRQRAHAAAAANTREVPVDPEIMQSTRPGLSLDNDGMKSMPGYQDNTRPRRQNPLTSYPPLGTPTQDPTAFQGGINTSTSPASQNHKKVLPFNGSFTSPTLFPIENLEESSPHGQPHRAIDGLMRNSVYTQSQTSVQCQQAMIVNPRHSTSVIVQPHQTINIQSQPAEESKQDVILPGLDFGNIDDARAHARGHVVSPRGTEGLPRNQIERQLIVKRLLENMQDLTQAGDLKTSTTFQNRWLGLKFTRDGPFPQVYPSTAINNFYSYKKKQLLCWELLHFAEQIHRDGLELPSLAPDCDIAKVVREQEYSFEERMNLIVDIIHFQKSRVDAMFSSREALEHLVLYPKLTAGSSKGNRNSNKKKAYRMDIGRIQEEQSQESKQTTSSANALTPAPGSSHDSMWHHYPEDLNPVSTNPPVYYTKRTHNEFAIDFDSEDPDAQLMKRSKLNPPAGKSSESGLNGSALAPSRSASVRKAQVATLARKPKDRQKPS